MKLWQFIAILYFMQSIGLIHGHVISTVARTVRVMPKRRNGKGKHLCKIIPWEQNGEKHTFFISSLEERILLAVSWVTVAIDECGHMHDFAHVCASKYTLEMEYHEISTLLLLEA